LKDITNDNQHEVVKLFRAGDVNLCRYHAVPDFFWLIIQQ
jgi:hypothetical protein